MGTGPDVDNCFGTVPADGCCMVSGTAPADGCGVVLPAIKDKFH